MLPIESNGEIVITLTTFVSKQKLVDLLSEINGRPLEYESRKSY